MGTRKVQLRKCLGFAIAIIAFAKAEILTFAGILEIGRPLSSKHCLEFPQT